jgi:hypothetical protein
MAGIGGSEPCVNPLYPWGIASGAASARHPRAQAEGTCIPAGVSAARPYFPSPSGRFSPPPDFEAAGDKGWGRGLGDLVLMRRSAAGNSDNGSGIGGGRSRSADTSLAVRSQEERRKRGRRARLRAQQFHSTHTGLA